MKNMQTNIGGRLREFRISRGYSIEELAHKASLNPAHLGKIERGERNFTIGSLEKIITALHISPKLLFDESEVVTPVDNPLLTKTVAYMETMSVEEQEHIYKTAVLLAEKGTK